MSAGHCDRCGAYWDERTRACSSCERNECARVAEGKPPSPSYSRPPPTSYRDERGTLHPGPGCTGYREHVGNCRPCYRALLEARHQGETWVVAYWSVLEGPAPVETDRALVSAPRSLPARWRRYAHPGPLILGMAGGWVLWLLPAAVHVPAIVALLVAAAAIHRYVPDTLPAARLRR